MACLGPLVMGISSAVLVAMGTIRDENWTGGIGDQVPDMMPTRLLAALRYATPVQLVVRLSWVLYCVYGPGAKGLNFDRPHFRCNGSIFHVLIVRVCG